MPCGGGGGVEDAQQGPPPPLREAPERPTGGAAAAPNTAAGPDAPTPPERTAALPADAAAPAGSPAAAPALEPMPSGHPSQPLAGMAAACSWAWGKLQEIWCSPVRKAIMGGKDSVLPFRSLAAPLFCVAALGGREDVILAAAYSVVCACLIYVLNGLRKRIWRSLRPALARVPWRALGPSPPRVGGPCMERQHGQHACSAAGPWVRRGGRLHPLSAPGALLGGASDEE
ncbi:hypothetical protein HYH03_002090 [Edaphochlamys debaryana]|uniref:Uncharacterized protein n=1 Tax=Edaphochlamys debaryana TaxID=47281 RepID=A0A836C5G0_9CHLO|nr:hypothetical protein HYH03_002090 [Edaphochlamys debaryana]|eukprot:KAG2499794.1 hypothetical protein HYH03_002090 [Edaphochlamys debaryana]